MHVHVSVEKGNITRHLAKVNTQSNNLHERKRNPNRPYQDQSGHAIFILIVHGVVLFLYFISTITIIPQRLQGANLNTTIYLYILCNNYSFFYHF